MKGLDHYAVNYTASIVFNDMYLKLNPDEIHACQCSYSQKIRQNVMDSLN